MAGLSTKRLPPNPNRFIFAKAIFPVALKFISINLFVYVINECLSVINLNAKFAHICQLENILRKLKVTKSTELWVFHFLENLNGILRISNKNAVHIFLVRQEKRLSFMHFNLENMSSSRLGNCYATMIMSMVFIDITDRVKC